MDKIRCRLCGVDMTSPQIVAEDVSGGSDGQRFYGCSNCGVAFLYPPLTEAEEARFYKEEFERFMQKRAGEGAWNGPGAHRRINTTTFSRRLPFFSDYIKKGRRVLEIGCASGFMLYPLKDAGMEVVGIEPSGYFGEYLRANGIELYSTLEEFKEKYKERRFDLILHFFLLEHIRKPVEFLEELVCLLDDGGVMIFEVPSRSDPLITIYNMPAFQKFYWSVAHNWYFNRASLEYILHRLELKFEILPAQRYDLSNHFVWALEGRPGGMGRYSAFFTKELEKAYKESMCKKGYCDTFFVKVYAPEE